MNLLKETRMRIKQSGHKISDIVHIGNQEYKCSWEQFKKMADQDYDSGFGGSEVALDLKIVFSDGLMMRREQWDGSEWWAYDTLDLSKDFKPVKTIWGYNL